MEVVGAESNAAIEINLRSTLLPQ